MSQRSGARRTWFVVSLAVVVAGCSSPAPSSTVGGRADAEVDALVDEFIARIGRGGGDWRTDTLRETGAPDFSPARFAARIEPLRDLLARVEAVATDGLTLPERNDRRTMIALLESDIYNAERRREWEMQPAIYVPTRQISGLFPFEGADRMVDQESATILLGAVSEAVEQGLANLGRPAARSTREAIFQTQATVETLRDGLGALVGDAATAGNQALVALDAYLEFLEDDLLPRSDGTWAIGKEHYDYTLKHRWLMEEDADDIIAIGREAFARTIAEAQEVAERISPGRPWVEVYEELKGEDRRNAPGVDCQVRRARRAARAVRRLAAHRVVTTVAGSRRASVRRS